MEESMRPGSARKKAILGCLRLLGVLRYLRYRNRHAITILGFHGVMDPTHGAAWRPLREHLRQTTFRRYLVTLQRHYEFISLNRAAAILAGKEPPIRNAMVVTFDDGYKNNFTQALPVLQELNIPATFYVVTDMSGSDDLYWFDELDYLIQKTSEVDGDLKYRGRSIRLPKGDRKGLDRIYAELRNELKTGCSTEEEFVGELHGIAEGLRRQVGHSLGDVRDSDDWSAVATWDDLRHASESPLVDIGSHTESHKRLAHASVASRRPELANSKRIIENEVGKPCPNFAYPSGSFDDDVARQTEDAGYTTAVTTVFGLNSARDDLFKLKRVLPADHLRDVELEAFVCGLSRGLGDMARRLRKLLGKSGQAAE